MVVFFSIAIFVILACTVPSMCLTVGSSILVQFFIRQFTGEVFDMHKLRRKNKKKIKICFRDFMQKFADTRELSIQYLYTQLSDVVKIAIHFSLQIHQSVQRYCWVQHYSIVYVVASFHMQLSAGAAIQIRWVFFFLSYGIWFAINNFPMFSRPKKIPIQ